MYIIHIITPFPEDCNFFIWACMFLLHTSHSPSSFQKIPKLVFSAEPVEASSHSDHGWLFTSQNSFFIIIFYYSFGFCFKVSLSTPYSADMVESELKTEPFSATNVSYPPDVPSIVERKSPGLPTPFHSPPPRFGNDDDDGGSDYFGE